MTTVALNSPAYRLQELLESVSDETHILLPYVGDIRDTCQQTGAALPKELEGKHRPGEQVELTAAAIRKILNYKETAIEEDDSDKESASEGKTSDKNQKAPAAEKKSDK